MTRTKRIYNKDNVKKAHRNDLTQNSYSSVNEVIRDINNPLRHSIHDYGLLYHPYIQLCMGSCPMCRDPKKDQKYIRKTRKSEFRELIKSELQKEDDLLENINEDELNE